MEFVERLQSNDNDNRDKKYNEKIKVLAPIKGVVGWWGCHKKIPKSGLLRFFWHQIFQGAVEILAIF